MMGDPVGRQDRLFYEFDLEEMVPGDHLLRRIDAVLDLTWLRSELAPYERTCRRSKLRSAYPPILLQNYLAGVETQ